VLTTSQAAAYLGLTESGVRRLCASGVIRAERFAGSWAIPEREIARAVNRPKRGKRAKKVARAA
jgi:excisionase family DNA binding protein